MIKINMTYDCVSLQKPLISAIIRRCVEATLTAEGVKVPCEINAGNYDLGKVNISYYKDNYMRDNLGKFGWNSGKKHRNDGVDVYEENGVYTVGMNDKDSFIIYTLFGNDSKCALNISMKGNGTVKVKLDNSEVIINVEEDNYKDIKIFDDLLLNGKHALRITTILPGVFIEKIKLISK